MRRKQIKSLAAHNGRKAFLFGCNGFAQAGPPSGLFHCGFESGCDDGFVDAVVRKVFVLAEQAHQGLAAQPPCFWAPQAAYPLGGKYGEAFDLHSALFGVCQHIAQHPHIGGALVKGVCKLGALFARNAQPGGVAGVCA